MLCITRAIKNLNNATTYDNYILLVYFITKVLQVFLRDTFQHLNSAAETQHASEQV